MQVSKRLFNLETETAFEILTKANKLQSEGKNIINLGIVQPDFLTPKNIVEAAIKALRDGHHGYTPSNGILELREAVSKYIYENYVLEGVIFYLQHTKYTVLNIGILYII